MMDELGKRRPNIAVSLFHQPQTEIDIIMAYGKIHRIKPLDFKIFVFLNGKASRRDCGNLSCENGIELDPLYFDLIIKCFEDETGQSANLVESGEALAQLTEGGAR